MDKVKFTIGGSSAKYRDKIDIVDLLRSGKKLLAILKRDADNHIVCYVENKPCGELVDRGMEGYATVSEISEEIGSDEVICNLIGILSRDIIGEIELSTKSKVEIESSLKEVVNKTIKSGFATKKEIDERIAYMKKSKVEAIQMIGVFESFKNYPAEIECKIPNPKVRFVDNGGLLIRAIVYTNINQNMLFEGERGVGKNVLTETLSWLYKRPLFEFSLNSQHDNTSLLGGKTFDEGVESKEESIGFFKKMSLAFKGGFGLKNLFKLSATDDEAIEALEIVKTFGTMLFGTKRLKFETNSIIQAAEYGGILVMDEFNTSIGNVMSIFNSMLDDRKRIDVPGYKQIICDNNFLVIATQNKDYQSTFANNEATVDRFVKVIFPELDNIEDIIRANVPDVTYDVLSASQKLFVGLKGSIQSGDVSERTMSIRGFITAARAVTYQKLPHKLALIDNVANKSEEKIEIELITKSIIGIFG